MSCRINGEDGEGIEDIEVDAVLQWECVCLASKKSFDASEQHTLPSASSEAKAAGPDSGVIVA